MAEALSEAVKSTGIKISWESGGQFLIDISTESVEVAKEMCKTAIKLSALYVGYQLLRPVIDAAIKKTLGGERDDQEVKDIKPGSLHVVLHCFTDERFLEVLTDYLSVKMKERLQEEFSQVGIKVKGLKVEIQNMDEVNEIKEAIYKRSHIDKNLCKDVKNTAMDDAESDIKKNEGEMESQMSAARRKQDEIVNNLDQTKIVFMATRLEDVQEGYDVTRFVGEVREDLLCLICNDVPKDPRLCKHKDHFFCLAHISQHLQHNSQTCPYCRDFLTLETLRRPTGFLKNYMDDLKIKCDHHDRGCPDVLRLEDLPRHVDQCEFAPVLCGNEGCGMPVNRSEKENHEKYLCKFRIAVCHDCTKIKASQDEMKASQDKIEKNVDELKASQNHLKANQDKIREIQDEMKANQDEMKSTQNQLKANQDEMKASQDKIKGELNATKVQNVKLEKKQDEINVKVNQMKENIEVIKKTQAEIKADQVMFKTEVREQFKTVTDMLNKLLQGRNVNNNGAQATQETTLAMKPADNNQDIIILGGSCGSRKKDMFTTVEKFNIVEGKSTELPPMNRPREASASCVYNGDVIVAGGWNGQDGDDSIEILNMNQQPLQWKMLQRKLPFKLYSHTVTVYHNNMYVVGGYNCNEKKASDEIHELSLIPPYTAKLLARMPQARRNHRAEIVNGKLLIFGGTTTWSSNDALDSVVVYDFITKEFKTCPPLPTAVCRMSTVTWGNTIIVVGGHDKNDQLLNDVVMYDTETGRSERLPSLRHKRYGCSAVIIDDVIVVLGGWNREQKCLNSVESFTIGSDGWKELPGMKEKRKFATALVLPHI